MKIKSNKIKLEVFLEMQVV